MTALSLRRAPGWALQGACVGMAAPDLDPWCPDDDLPPDVRARLVGLAKDVCARCPVRAACLEEALETGEAWSVRGGTTPAERRRLAARRGLPRPAAAGRWQHATPAGYKAHGCRCLPCCDAHARDVAAWRQRRRWDATPRLTLVVHELVVPSGAGRRRAFPGQMYLELPGAAA